MPKEYYRDYARAWRAKNKEKLKLYEHNRYHTKKKYQQRAKRSVGAKLRCHFCNKLLDKEMRRSRYCVNCLNVPRLKTWLQHVYRLRAYQRKNGLPETPIKYQAEPLCADSDLKGYTRNPATPAKQPEQPND